MTNDFFSQISTSAQIGSGLFLIALALWVLIFRREKDNRARK